MNEQLLELNMDISAHVYELHELQQVIKSLAADPEVDPVYMEEIGDRYMKLCNKLKIILEAYFQEERNAGIPAEFSYRKLYKQLVD